MSVITVMANNLRLELEGRGIVSLSRTDCEAIIAAVVMNTAELARAVEAAIARPTAPEEAGHP
jgi:RNase P/RNase MRP subunit POP5